MRISFPSSYPTVLVQTVPGKTPVSGETVYLKPPALEGDRYEKNAALSD